MEMRRTFGTGERGTALVEFALAVPLIVAVLFGLVEFGYVVYAKGVITNASREGARFGVVLSTPRKTEAEVQAKVQEYLTKSGFTDPVTVAAPGAGGAGGTALNVNVSYTYTFQVLPRFVKDLVGSITMTANSVMLME
jgi:Flp pilus assembly protein TadG